jgi:hypothetical protein
MCLFTRNRLLSMYCGFFFAFRATALQGRGAHFSEPEISNHATHFFKNELDAGPAKCPGCYFIPLQQKKKPCFKSKARSKEVRTVGFLEIGFRLFFLDIW